MRWHIPIPGWYAATFRTHDEGDSTGPPAVSISINSRTIIVGDMSGSVLLCNTCTYVSVAGASAAANESATERTLSLAMVHYLAAAGQRVRHYPELRIRSSTLEMENRLTWSEWNLINFYSRIYSRYFTISMTELMALLGEEWYVKMKLFKRCPSVNESAELCPKSVSNGFLCLKYPPLSRTDMNHHPPRCLGPVNGEPNECFRSFRNKSAPCCWSGELLITTPMRLLDDVSRPPAAPVMDGIQ